MSPVASTRWCPTPEQVMILEEMYRGGVRTPNAAQIQQITAHLSLYGKIEGKNVFYWFQNHKARDRQKLRKRLLFGKQVFQQHQQPHQHHQQQQQQQQQMMVINTSVPPPPAILKLDHFQQPPPHHDLLHQLHHFDHRQPAAPRYAASSVAFHHLPPPVTGFVAHQGRREGDAHNQGMSSHSHAWNCGRQKARQISIISNDNDWTKKLNDDDDDDQDQDHDDDVDDDVVGSTTTTPTTTTTTRPLKTLQLFPINDKISLKQQLHSSSLQLAHS